MTTTVETRCSLIEAVEIRILVVSASGGSAGTKWVLSLEANGGDTASGSPHNVKLSNEYYDKSLSFELQELPDIIKALSVMQNAMEKGTAMSALNAASKRLLDTAFPNGGAYLVWGRYDANDDLQPKVEGPAGTFDLPDDADLYYCVGSILPGKDRTAIDRVWILVIDDVGKEIDQWAFDATFPLKPSYRVKSSAGSFHYLFFIDGGMAPDEFRALRLAMRANAIWGDAHNTGAAAIYRLPQGIHSKSTHGGWKVHGDNWTGFTYTPEQLWNALAPAGAPRAPGRGSAGDLVEDEALLDELVDLIPNDVWDWDKLVNVGRAIWGASDGLADGTFHRFAAKYKGNDPDVTQARWDSYHDASIGRYWLLRAAKAADPAGAEAWLRKEARTVFTVIDEPESDEVLALQRDVANLIVRVHGDRIRWNVSSDRWHRFDKTWTESPHPLGYRLAKRWADGAAGQLGTAARAAVSKSAFYEGVEKILRADEKLAVVKTDFDTDNWLLGTPGGTVDLRSGAKRDAAAAEMISLSTSVAPADEEACPRWLKFMDWVCTDPATGKVDGGMLRTLKQWAGYNLTGDVTQEMVAFLHGGGSNGKGTYIETLQTVLGSYFYMADKDLFMEGKFKTHTEEIAALAGKRMVAADEVPTNAKWNESLLKGVSGGGVMTTRHLYGRMFSFPIRFKVTVIGNEKPAFQGAINEALKRRLHLIEFRMTAKPRDPALKSALAAEAPGVLRWMINGLLDMQKEPGGKLFVADSVNTATDEYFNENDLLKQWISECVVATPGASVTATEALKSWRDYRDMAGNNQQFNSTKEFRAEMERRGYVWKPTNSANVIKDIVLRSAVFAF